MNEADLAPCITRSAAAIVWTNLNLLKHSSVPGNFLVRDYELCGLLEWTTINTSESIVILCAKCSGTPPPTPPPPTPKINTKSKYIVKFRQSMQKLHIDGRVQHCSISNALMHAIIVSGSTKPELTQWPLGDLDAILKLRCYILFY